MFSYMYEVNLPKYDVNANSVEIQRPNGNREKSARERTKLKRSKSTHNIDLKMRPKSHRFRREKDFFDNYNEVRIIDLEEERDSNNFSAWCVSFDSESVSFSYFLSRKFLKGIYTLSIFVGKWQMREKVIE